MAEEVTAPYNLADEGDGTTWQFRRPFPPDELPRRHSTAGHSGRQSQADGPASQCVRGRLATPAPDPTPVASGGDAGLVRRRPSPFREEAGHILFLVKRRDGRQHRIRFASMTMPPMFGFRTRNPRQCRRLPGTDDFPLWEYFPSVLGER